MQEELRPLVKSRQRIADHGEVFTPRWLVDEMLDQVRDETYRIDSRFLEPACGSGNFIVPVLERKLEVVQAKYGKSTFERRHYSLFGLMCIYGIELLPDNAAECRENLVSSFARTLRLSAEDSLVAAARAVVGENIVQGDAIALSDSQGEAIVFPEWAYVGRGRYQRRDFRFDALTQRSSVSGTLFDQFEEHEIFTPVRTWPVLNLEQIAQGDQHDRTVS